ncbi:MAG: hypothetical protein SGPRY_006664 [Prymnesium sp.]
MLVDARHVLSTLKTKVRFTVAKCLRKQCAKLFRPLNLLPALLSSSNFKSRHASKFLQPYATQLDLFKSISKEGPRLVLLRSPPDTGKTSLAPSLVELFPDQKARRLHLRVPFRTTVVFSCLARRVNLEVAQNLYNMGIPFAWVHNRQIQCSWLCGLRGSSTSNSIAQMEEKLRLGIERINETSGGLSNQRVRKRHVQEGRLKLLASNDIHTRSFHVIRHPRMFVCDVASCAWLCKQLDMYRTILMIDEPTMGADQGNGEALPINSLTGYMVQGMLHAPYKTIWSSATLPPGDELPTIINAFTGVLALEREHFNVDSSAVDELASMQLNVGVLLVRPNGQVALPHAMCTEPYEGETCTSMLKDFVSRLKKEPLLLKAYTAQAICSIQDRLLEEDIPELSKAANFTITPIDEYFDDVSRLSHSSLRTYAILLLEALADTGNEDLIRKVCTPSSNLKAAMFPPFDPSKLLLENASYFPGMTLTVSSNPSAQIAATANDLIKEFPSLKKLSKEIEANEAALEKQLASIRKEAEKVKGGEDRIDEIIASKMR